MDNICEICGSKNIKITDKENVLRVRYGSEESYLTKEITCLECNNIIVTKESSEYYDDAKERSIENAVYNILTILEREYSFTTYERILGLDFGTLYNWKVKKNIPSKAEFILLNIIVENISAIIHNSLI